MGILDKIKFVPFPADRYVREYTPKKQIVLHHTVSGKGVDGDIHWWLQDKRRIATAFIIGRDGVIHQNFGSKYWAYHLGVKSHAFSQFGLDYIKLDKFSIGIELDSWGALAKNDEDGKFYPVKDHNEPDTRFKPVVAPITTYDDLFRGHRYYESYTDEQLQSMSGLVRYLSHKYMIPLVYSHDDMFKYSKNALSGHRGIYTHVSYRSDKSDCHPQPELISILKGLSNGSI